MPLFDYSCEDCGKLSELLVVDSKDPLQCKACGSSNLKKLHDNPISRSTHGNQQII